MNEYVKDPTDIKAERIISNLKQSQVECYDKTKSKTRMTVERQHSITKIIHKETGCVNFHFSPFHCCLFFCLLQKGLTRKIRMFCIVVLK